MNVKRHQIAPLQMNTYLQVKYKIENIRINNNVAQHKNVSDGRYKK